MSGIETIANDLSIAEQDAFGLSEAAVLLDLARQKRASDPSALVGALNNNLELWVAVRSLIMRDDNHLDQDLKDKLMRLSQYVAQKTFEAPESPSEEVIDSFININLQIAEGLLEGQNKA